MNEIHSWLGVRRARDSCGIWMRFIHIPHESRMNAKRHIIHCTFGIFGIWMNRDTDVRFIYMNSYTKYAMNGVSLCIHRIMCWMDNEWTATHVSTSFNESRATHQVGYLGLGKQFWMNNEYQMNKQWMNSFNEWRTRQLLLSTPHDVWHDSTSATWLDLCNMTHW